MAEQKRVRILVAIDAKGEWSATGFHRWDDAEAMDCIFIDDLGVHLSYHWIEADVPIPEPSTIEGEVSPGEPEPAPVEDAPNG